MSDIKFDIYESPANDGEKKKYHVRNTNKQTIHSKDLIHEATLYTSVSRSDWAAVVEGLIDILSEKLGDGKRIHINGLGYFSVSIGSTESENPKKMTRGTVQITGVNFQPEKSFKKSIISRAHFVRERYKVHTVDLSEGGNLAASKIRNLECPSYEICLIDYGCGKFNRKIHIMEQYP